MPSLGGFPSEYCHAVCSWKKLELLGYVVVKFFWRYIYSFSQLFPRTSVKRFILRLSATTLSASSSWISCPATFHTTVHLSHYYFRQQGGAYVIVLSVCLSVCHSVSMITDERGNGRRQNLAGTGKRWLSRRTFGGDPDPRVDSGSLFHYLHHCGIRDFGHLLAFFIQSTADLTILGEIADADNVMHPYPTKNIRIRIQINPAIRVRIPGDFWSKF